MSRTILPEHAEELYEAEDGETVGPWRRIEVVAHEARRWMQGHSLILDGGGGRYWALNYDLGLTEEQPHELPWRNSREPVALTRVYPHEVIRIEWRPVPPKVATGGASDG